MLKRLFPFIYVVLCAAMVQAVPITGKVVGPDNKPVAGAQVVIVTAYDGSTKPLVLASDGAGVFKADLEPSVMWPDSFGTATAYAPELALGSSVLKAGENIIKLEKSLPVQGMVKDKAGKPLADVVVKLAMIVFPRLDNGRSTLISVPEPLAAKVTTKSDANGQWSLNGVPANSSASVFLDDPRYARAYAQLKAGLAAGVTTITARPGASLKGRVVHEDGKPAPGIAVNAMGQGASSQSETAADGTYTLTGLISGLVTVTVTDPAKQWVAPAIESIKAKEGESAHAADMVLSTGAILEGTVRDKASGKPIVGAQVYSYGPPNPPNSGGSSSTRSDKAGHYQLRVAPGKNMVALWQIAKYLPLEKMIEVEVKKGETKNLPIQLSKGSTVTGTALDAAGKPAVNAELRASLAPESNRGGNWVKPMTIKPNANGKWTLEGLQPGKWELTGIGEWEVVDPKTVTVPMDAPVKVTVRKIQFLTLKGRVVTKDHKPLEGVKIKAALQIPQGTNSVRNDMQELTTDAQGQFVVEKLRPDYKVSLSTTMPGYNYVAGGTVTQQGAGFEAQDLVLVPLTAKIEGRVVDATGQPVAGASVMSPNGDVNLQVVSDAAGKFVLTSLPAGPVMIIGGAKNLIGEARDVDGSKPVTLTLKPLKPLASNDVSRAYDILDDLWATTEGSKYYRDNIPTALAPYDPDLAIKLVARKDGTLDDGILSRIIANFAQANPARAAAWAPPKMEQIKDPRIAFSSWMTFALGLAATQPDLAKQYYQKAKDYDKAEAAKHAQDQQYNVALAMELAKLARRLGLKAEADQYAQIAVAAVRAAKDRQPWTLGSLGAVEYDETAKMIDELPADQRKQALQQAASGAAAYNVKLARKWLDKLKEVEKADPNGGNYSGGVTQQLVQVLGKTDPAGALELARSVTEAWARPDALADAVPFQPRDVALQVLREVGDTAEQYGSVANLARLAALAYNLDPKLGKELFALAKDHLETSKAQSVNQTWYGGDDGTAAFAFYYSRIDPAASRLLLEAEFARDMQNLTGSGDDYQRSYQLRAVVVAMAAIDVDRALELSFMMPPPAKGQEWSNPQVEAQRAIAQYILLPEAARRAKPFQQWDIVSRGD